MTSQWVWWVLLGWPLVALTVGPVVGRVIRQRDRQVPPVGKPETGQAVPSDRPV